jgi:predicted HTH domain antitoxin
MGQSSIARSRLGCRLPHERSDIDDDYASPGPIITYKLSPEEIAARYGPPKKREERRLSLKSIKWAVENSCSLNEAAKALKVSKEHLKKEMEWHGVAAPDYWEEEKIMETIQEKVKPTDQKPETLPKKSRLELARERLTKEAFLEMKAKGMTDRKIMRECQIPNDIFYILKKEWFGPAGQNKEVTKTEIRPEKTEASFLSPDVNVELGELDLSAFRVFNWLSTKTRYGKWITVGKRGISISWEIARDLRPGALVEFYLSPEGKILVMRECLNGLVVRGGNSKNRSKEISCKALSKALMDLGVCLPVRFMTEWDEKLQAWVGRR